MKNIMIFILLNISFALFSEDPIGFVQFFDGDYIHTLNGEEIDFVKGSPIYSSSEVDITSDLGMFRIVTADSFQVFSFFPVQGFSVYEPIEEENRSRLIELCGGVTIGGMKGASDIFDWNMDINTLDSSFLENDGFHLALSKYNDSKSTKNYFPLTFKLKDKLDIIDINYVTYSGSRDTVFLEEFSGKFIEEAENWIYKFDSFPYESGTTYTVMCVVNLKDGSNETWEFRYKILGPDDIKSFNKRFTRKLKGTETPFEKKIGQINFYRKYKLTLSAKKLEMELDINE